jgi:DNA polymerase-3 subunit delta
MQLELFLGDDAFRRRRAMEERLGAWEAEVDPMDVEVFDLSDPAQLPRGITAVRIGPLLSETRVVVWRNFEVVLQPKDSVLAQLEAAIPAADSAVVLLAEGHTPAARNKKKDLLPLLTTCRPLQRRLERAEQQRFDLPPPWDRAGQLEVVRVLADDAGVELAADKREELLDRVGADSARLYGELVKLAELAAAGRPITSGTLRQAVHSDKADLAALHLAVLKGDSRRALALVEQVVAAGMKAAECASLLQREAMATLLVSRTTAADDGMVAGWLGCSPGVLYHRRREWARLSRKRCEATMEMALSLAVAVTQNRPLTTRQLLQRYALSCAA